LVGWICACVSAIGMLVGAVRPPYRFAGQWLAGLYIAGAVGFLLIEDGIAMAFFTGLGTWIGTLLTGRKGNRSHFRAGALGWWGGAAVGIWWLFY
ncbi:MAG: hypothetical protein M3Y56_03595, partial [Armatimonadota bacterium]|nr:hypothetical protein [Armatimonadota bacterium]